MFKSWSEEVTALKQLSVSYGKQKKKEIKMVATL
jgi:hypothetical protein